jgi:hypothetical protein
MHSVFPTAVEKRWNQFPNRYRDDNMDFVYETREAKIIGDPNADGTSFTRDKFHNVCFLRPSRIPPSERQHHLGKKIRWTEKAEKITISHIPIGLYHPKWYVSYSTYGPRWYCHWHHIPENETYSINKNSYQTRGVLGQKF